MGIIHDVFSSRNGSSTVTLNTHIGNRGRIFYDETTGELRMSDGATPGGFPIPITIATAEFPGSVKPGAGFSIGAGGLLTLNAGPMFELDSNDVFQLKVATETQFGGVKLGPGVITNSQGQIIIDSEGLDFSFGDFSAIVGIYSDSTEYALLSSIGADEDVVLASNGDGNIRIVGEFTVHTTNGAVTGSLETDPIFKISDDGQVMILVPDVDTNAGAVEIVGSSTGSIIAPGQPGAMLHLTGQSGEQCYFYMDGNDNYASIVGRRWNGTVATPTQVLANDDVLRINATAATNSGVPGQAIAQISFTALENQTPTAQGSEIGFTVTPVGQPTTNRVKVLKVDGVGITTDRLVKARNYEGAVRNVGTVSAGGGDEITINFATDHIVRCNYSTEPIEVGFSNYTAGRTVTLIATNTSGGNRELDIGIAAANTQGDATIGVNNGTTAIVTYYCTGTTVNDVFASTVYDT